MEQKHRQARREAAGSGTRIATVDNLAEVWTALQFLFSLLVGFSHLTQAVLRALMAPHSKAAREPPEGDEPVAACLLSADSRYDG